MGNFTVFAILNDGGGGGGVGEGVWDRGKDGGGVGGWGIFGNPCLINWTMLYGEACAAPSSSLTGGSISGLYLGLVLLLSLNNFPLRVAPNIKVIA